MRLVFASPTYGPVDPKALRSQRNAIMHAARNGVEWVGDASPDRVKFDASRNMIVQSIIDLDDVDGVFWCDSDIVLPSHAVTSLVKADKDFITGMYFQRYAPHWPLIASFNPTGGEDRQGKFNWFADWPENVIAPIDGCGFGCVVTSIRMLRALPAPWFTFEKFSEDFDFCLRAKAAGFQLHVHTGVTCGHLTDPIEVTVKNFRAFYADSKTGKVAIPTAK